MEGLREGSDGGEGGGKGRGSGEGMKGEEVEKERVPLTLCSVEIINSTFL